jgi:hypothetical protein
MKEVLLQKGLQQDAAHFSGAQNGHANLGQLCGYLRGLNGDLGHVFLGLIWSIGSVF